MPVAQRRLAGAVPPERSTGTWPDAREEPAVSLPLMPGR